MRSASGRSTRAGGGGAAAMPIRTSARARRNAPVSYRESDDDTDALETDDVADDVDEDPEDDDADEGDDEDAQEDIDELDDGGEPSPSPPPPAKALRMRRAATTTTARRRIPSLSEVDEDPMLDVENDAGESTDGSPPPRRTGQALAARPASKARAGATAAATLEELSDSDGKVRRRAAAPEVERIDDDDEDDDGEDDESLLCEDGMGGFYDDEGSGVTRGSETVNGDEASELVDDQDSSMAPQPPSFRPRARGALEISLVDTTDDDEDAAEKKAAAALPATRRRARIQLSEHDLVPSSPPEDDGMDVDVEEDETRSGDVDVDNAEEPDDAIDEISEIPNLPGADMGEDDMDDDEFVQHLLDESVRRANKSKLTARQRAARATASGPVMDLDEFLAATSGKQKKAQRTSEEEALRRSEHARRRKLQVQQKAEESKNATIQRLLKKQASKKSRAEQAEERRAEQRRAMRELGGGAFEGEEPVIRFTNAIDERSGECAFRLQIPPNVVMEQVFPGAGPARPYPSKEVPVCDAPGCGKGRKYKLPGRQPAAPLQGACSLECFRVLKQISSIPSA